MASSVFIGYLGASATSGSGGVTDFGTVRTDAGTAAAPSHSFIGRPADGLYNNGVGVDLVVGGVSHVTTFPVGASPGVGVPTNTYFFFDGGSDTYLRFAGTTLSMVVDGVLVASWEGATPGIDFSGPVTNLTVVKGQVTAAS